MEMDYFIVRTKSERLYFGTPYNFERDRYYGLITLDHVRFIHTIAKGQCLFALAVSGAEKINISEEAAVVILTDVLEMILCSDEAVANLDRTRWEIDAD